MQLTAKTLTGGSLRIDNAKPCDTSFVTNQLKNRAVADHTPWTGLYPYAGVSQFPVRTALFQKHPLTFIML